MIHKLETGANRKVSESTVRRLTVYLHYLESLPEARAVSSDELAALVATTPAQVRKDLSFFGSFGTRGLGYSAAELIANLRKILGVGELWRICIVGAGKIGLALAQYPGFAGRGFTVTGVYDCDPAKIGQPWESLTIRNIDDLPKDAGKTPYDIGVIAVPSESGQDVANIMVEANIRAIMNFAPVQIVAPPHIVVRMVNMVLEFEALSFALTQRAE